MESDSDNEELPVNFLSQSEHRQSSCCDGSHPSLLVLSVFSSVFGVIRNQGRDPPVKMKKHAQHRNQLHLMLLILLLEELQQNILQVDVIDGRGRGVDGSIDGRLRCSTLGRGWSFMW